MAALLGGGSTQVNSTTPPATSLRIQTSVAGKAIPIITGQVRVAPNLIDSQDFASHTVNTGGGSSGGGGKGGGSGCFAPEMLISTPIGLRRIAELRPGDEVWSFDPVAATRVVGTVTDRFEHMTRDNGDKMLRIDAAVVPGWPSKMIKPRRHGGHGEGKNGPRRGPRISFFLRVLRVSVVKLLAGRRVALHLTRNHYLWLDGIKKRAAQDWQVGDALAHESGKRAIIVAVLDAPDIARTYNLTVEPHHNFFACGILAHNGFGGGGGKGGNTQTTYTVAPVYGICEGPVAGFVQVWNSSTAVSLASLNLTGFGGGYPGTVWGYMASNHPGNALAYTGLAYAAAGPMNLDTSSNLPNLNFEMLAAINSAIAGLPDADPASWITDLLTNQFYGVGYPATRLGDLSTYSAFCRANALVVSDALTDQRALNDYLKDLLEATYSEFIFVDGGLTIVPRGMQALSANGASYTPQAVLATLGPDDFLPNTGGGGTSAGSSALSNDPVIWTVARRSDAFNQITVNCNDRGNAYNPNPQTAQNLAAIIDYGLRADSVKQYSCFAFAGAALTSAHYLLEQAQIVNTATFALGMKYARIAPMDLLAGVPAPSGVGTVTVRIVEITQNEDFTFTVNAEEYPIGGVAPPQYNSENPNPTLPGINEDPGPVNAPLLFGAPVELATNQGLEIWCAISGSNPATYGGCDIWGASDASGPYQKLGTLKGASRMGVTTADFAAGSDPDTTHTLSVDLTESAGSLSSGTSIDADQANTLCLVRGANGDEYVSYQTATLAAASQYTLGTYLRRGQYETAIVDHPAGSAFARIDQNIFRIGYQVGQIGQTQYLKFLAFNNFGGGEEQLASVSDYAVVLPAPPPPSDVTGFGAAQSGNVVAFAWDPVPDFALKGYDIGYAPQGTSAWSGFTPLTETTAGTEMTNAEVPPGIWTFGIRAHDIADQLSPQITTVNLTIINENPVIYDADEAVTSAPADGAPASPSSGWGGTRNGFVLHYTGVLISENQFTPSHYGDYTDIDDFVHDPVASASYTTATIDTGYNDTLRVFNTNNFRLGPGQGGGAPALAFAIDTWLTGAGDPNSFTPWTIAQVTMRYLRAELVYSGITAGNVAVIADFTPMIDKAPSIEQSNGAVNIAGGGTSITFPAPFHFAPVVTATATSTGASSASAANVSATGFDLHVWTGSADTGGTASWSASGE